VFPFLCGVLELGRKRLGAWRDHPINRSSLAEKYLVLSSLCSGENGNNTPTQQFVSKNAQRYAAQARIQPRTIS